MTNESLAILGLMAALAIYGHFRMKQYEADRDKHRAELEAAAAAQWAASPINPASPNFDQAQYNAWVAEQAAADAENQ